LGNIVEIIFSLSLLLNALLFIPQALRIFKVKSASGLSLLTFAGFNFIQLATVCHAYLTKDWILFFGYLLSLITCGIVTFLIVRYRSN
jgi:MtN3 and saliva related transmembrane protein